MAFFGIALTQEWTRVVLIIYGDNKESLTKITVFGSI